MWERLLAEALAAQPTVDSSGDRCRAELNRLLGATADQHRREVRLIAVAAEEGVPAALRAGEPSERLVEVLVDEEGLAREAAEFAVNTWVAVLGLTTRRVAPLTHPIVAVAAAEGAAGAAAPAVAPPPRSRRTLVIIAAVALVLGGLAAVLAVSGDDDPGVADGSVTSQTTEGNDASSSPPASTGEVSTTADGPTTTDGDRRPPSEVGTTSINPTTSLPRFGGSEEEYDGPNRSTTTMAPTTVPPENTVTPTTRRPTGGGTPTTTKPTPGPTGTTPPVTTTPPVQTTTPPVQTTTPPTPAPTTAPPVTAAPTTMPPQPTSSPPTANNDSAIVAPFGTVCIVLLANDSAPDGHNLTISNIGVPGVGSISGTCSSGRGVSYTAGASSDSFTYVARDQVTGLTDSASVTVTVG